MSSLVENILAIEKEASDVVARAHEEAAAITKRASEEIAAYGATLAEATERRIAEFRRQAEARHQQDLVQATAEFNAALEAIERVPAEVVQKQVTYVVNTFREL